MRNRIVLRHHIYTAFFYSAYPDRFYSFYSISQQAGASRAYRITSCLPFDHVVDSVQQ